MIDLSHGSRYVPGQPSKARVQVGEVINALIDEALERERAAQPERDYIGMSELGDECLRRVFYNVEKAPGKPFDGSKLRIFETGHLYEAMVARWLIAVGFQLWTDDGIEQFEAETADGMVKGHIDGQILSGPHLPGLVYPAIWENKALGSKWWRLIVKNGLQQAEPKYYGQCQLYAAYFKVSNALFSAINKDTEEIYWEVVKLDLAEAQRFSDRGVSVIQSLRAGIPPERLCSDPQHFQAKWCRYVYFCFKDGR